ncbi:PLP-dependent aminotransferase family protein [Noviherbaspirillum saxi]|uniref:PLP-dependent aminotransferase family protein n=1 Tax=Noviherbaspirillum saxi TaxID=2320863 RepID=A0A3A3G9D0_9BURK|nr:PLP-dependent aminotransferase family protein [Noviherbaspirillum saxi]RJF97479.1 PLP-dependent aminotransferase family protein [Noviherbaspirillum saxi]
MKDASFAEFLLIRIDRSADQPMNRQIYLIIRDAILARLLPVGFRMPSTRELAKGLGMSRNTVTYGYDQLMAEGYLESRTGAGTYVADTVPDQFSQRQFPKAAAPDGPELSARGAKLIAQAGASDLQWGAFMPGVPDVTQFPHRVWSRLQNKHWRRSRAELLTYGGAGGHAPLREAIAEHLRIARSVNCRAEQVIITTGTHQSLDVVVKLLGEVGDSAWIEDPCYWGTRSVLESTSIKPVAIPVDDEGLALQRADLRRPPRFICVTPSHQYPLGMVMSLSRRRLLLEYAATQKAWIIEDDYDSEFRYGSRPLASLQGMDRHDRVLYMGTFSKTLFPGLRVGFIVVPESLAAAVSTAVSELYRGSQGFLQAVLADFMNEGHFASHVRRMSILYAERLQALRSAIEGHFGDSMAAIGDEAGLHLVLRLPPGSNDVAISRAARAAGIIARPLSGYYAGPDTARSGLLLGYACVPVEQIRSAFDTLAAIIREHCGMPFIGSCSIPVPPAYGTLPLRSASPRSRAPS